MKRRSLAKELCDEGAVSVNGRPARAGRDLVLGDEITLHLRNRVLSVAVAALSDAPVPSARARELYRLIRDERPSPGDAFRSDEAPGPDEPDEPDDNSEREAVDVD